MPGVMFCSVAAVRVPGASGVLVERVSNRSALGFYATIAVETSYSSSPVIRQNSGTQKKGDSPHYLCMMDALETQSQLFVRNPTQ